MERKEGWHAKVQYEQQCFTWEDAAKGLSVTYFGSMNISDADPDIMSVIKDKLQAIDARAKLSEQHPRIASKLPEVSQEPRRKLWCLLVQAKVCEAIDQYGADEGGLRVQLLK